MTATAGRTVAQKMGVRPGSRAHLVNAPDEVVAGLALPPLDVTGSLSGGFDYLHLFVTTQAEMRETFPAIAARLAAGGMLWLSWPKGGRLGSDLTIRSVIEIGYGFGLVESTCLRISEVWAGLKFTHPKAGKTYRNSYGTLPGQSA